MAYDKKNLHRGGNVADDDEKFLKPSAGSDPFNQWASGEGYNARWDDDAGVKAGEQSRGGSQAWESRGADDSDFLRPSQSETMSRTSRTTQDIYGEVMEHGGPGPYGDGGSAVKQIGGGGGKPRYKSNAGRKSNDSDGL